MLEIPDIFFGGGETVDAGSEPTYAEKIRVPPWDLNMHGRVNIIFAYTVIQKSFIFFYYRNNLTPLYSFFY